jgi:hypothetical protein
VAKVPIPHRRLQRPLGCSGGSPGPERMRECMPSNGRSLDTLWSVAASVRKATITCPLCGHQASETMPSDTCQFFYVCQGCGEMLRPREGDCCVFCSYADRRCPPQQRAG